jgi:hypothetical protein
MRTDPTLRRAPLAVLITGLLLGAAALLGVGAVLVPVAPLLLLVVSLLLGHYPGHEAIVRLSERIAARRRPTAVKASPRPARPPVRIAGGGLLLALALSGRAPPARA